MAAVAAVAVTALFAGSAYAVAGAAFTTIGPAPDNNCFSGPGLVNCNIYGGKDDVWINGGPAANGLTDGTYYFAVTDPSGATLLSTDSYSDRLLTISGGEISSTTSHTTSGAPPNLLVQLSPYADTSNPGGEYKLWICQAALDGNGDPILPSDGSPPSTNDLCKTDNFKVHQSICIGDTCNPTPFGTVEGEKYYDANMNGQLDSGELGIPNWAIDFTDGTANTLFTDSSGQFSVNLAPDSYTFAEEQATNTTGPPFNLPEWIQTGNTADQSSNSSLQGDKSYAFTLNDTDVVSGLNFGNVCLGAGGGLTLGFWSSKNGQKLVTSSDLSLLSGLNLIKPKATSPFWQAFDPTSASGLASWLLSANATNMAYMLSAQLAAMELNVRHGFVDGTATVLVGGSFMTINALMAAANTELGLAPYTVSASADRTLETTYKSALDAGNNNVNFVQPSPSTCPAPTFPHS